MMKNFMIGCSALALAACGQETETAETTENNATVDSVAEEANVVSEPSAEEKLEIVLASQEEDVKARYQFRHPKETLLFFGIEPGMTVVDSLPGNVWYSGILSEYLGPAGKVIGADYSMPMWRLFGGFADEEWLAERENWHSMYLNRMAEAHMEERSAARAFVYGSLPEDMHGMADTVLIVRATHHLSRFEEEGGYFTEALKDIGNILKPNGIVGVVQHRAPETHSDEWAEGDNGYVKTSRIVSFFENNGFELVASSEINANPNDQPTEDDIVWRLPPTLGTSEDDPELRAEMEAIGESDRMTLKFRKN